ncbi:MAG TPA: hypothetical protein DCZ48_12515 [Methylococcaceae bacterium]|nr:hypothetical protein [Methylococcaceae bacterium]
MRANQEWLSLFDAAREISETFGEDFDEKELLSLCVDGRLILSVMFENGILIRPGKLVDSDGVEWEDMPDPMSGRYMTSTPVSEQKFINFTDEAYSIKGAYDLPMIGMERKLVDEMINPRHGVVLPSESLLGAFVVDPIDKTKIFQIITNFERLSSDTQKNSNIKNFVPPVVLTRTDSGQKLDGYFVPTQLPVHAKLGIRRECLSQFVKQNRTPHVESAQSTDADISIQRSNEFNECIKIAIKEFHAINGYYPSTSEEVLCRMINKPPRGYDVRYEQHGIIINNIPTEVSKIKRNINNWLKKSGMRKKY